MIFVTIHILLVDITNYVRRFVFCSTVACYNETGTPGAVYSSIITLHFVLMQQAVDIHFMPLACTHVCMLQRDRSSHYSAFKHCA
jgi:hypothetical protein